MRRGRDWRVGAWSLRVAHLEPGYLDFIISGYTVVFGALAGTILHGTLLLKLDR